MRKLKLLAIALMVGSASIFATNIDELKKPNEELRKEIVELLKTTDIELNSEITVAIKFTFNSDSEIVVLGVDSKNNNVLKYVRENLNYKKLDNPGKRDKLYTIPLKIEAV